MKLNEYGTLDFGDGQFNPDRLKLIRERRGLSVVQLGRDAGVATKSIHNAEKGVAVPSAETIDRLAEFLDVPQGFLVLDSIPRLEEEAVSFRRASKVPVYQRKSALAAGDIASEIYGLLNSYFEFPEPAIPDLSDYKNASQAAEDLRAMWGLGSGTAPNMVHLLESKGVFVTALASDFRQVDAFSYWRESRPFVMLNTLKSAERGRMDAAHELGHLVMHRLRPGGSPTKEQETEADVFGRSFLVPTSAVRESGWRNPMLSDVLVHKLAWQVSATLFVLRLREAGPLTEWSYRSLMVELSQRGYRSGEPDGIDRESSQFFKRALEQLRKEGVRLAHLADQLKLDPDDLRSYFFGLALA